MPTITTKVQLIDRLRESRLKLEKMLAKLTPEQMVQPGTCGQWSAKDMLAHLDHWQRLHLGWMAAVQRGERPEVPAPGITWKEVDRLNQQIYEAHCDELLDQVLAGFRATFEELMVLIEATPEKDLFTPGIMPFIGKKVTLERWYTHYAFHDGWARSHIYNCFIREPRK